jgi:RNA polymerase sigma-70 factor (ECF subfamily)
MFLWKRSISRTSDEDLVLLLRKGHQSALGELWDRYAHLLFGVGMKYLKDTERSKDEVVELFATLPDLVKKHAVQRFRPWVHTVMRNRCLLALRNAKPTASLPEELVHATDPRTEEEAVLHEATLQQLEHAIGQLNDDQQRCIRLFHLERNNYQQVSEQLGISVEQVRSHLQNGRRNLRHMIQRAPAGHLHTP